MTITELDQVQTSLPTSMTNDMNMISVKSAQSRIDLITYAITMREPAAPCAKKDENYTDAN
jgi:hypothetical protein